MAVPVSQKLWSVDLNGDGESLRRCDSPVTGLLSSGDGCSRHQSGSFDDSILILFTCRWTAKANPTSWVLLCSILCPSLGNLQSLFESRSVYLQRGEGGASNWIAGGTCGGWRAFDVVCAVASAVTMVPVCEPIDLHHQSIPSLFVKLKIKWHIKFTKFIIFYEIIIFNSFNSSLQK